MIRRVISILIGLAGALLLWSWWQRDHEPVQSGLQAPATVLAQVALDDGEAIPLAPEAAAVPDLAPGTPDGAEPLEAPQPPVAGWTPTLVDFDRGDRNAPTVVLQRADAALEAGKVFQPPGESAVDLYLSVLDAAPGNARARQGLDRALDRLAAQVQLQLDQGDYPAAHAALPVLEQLRPDLPGPVLLRTRLQGVDAIRLDLERANRAFDRGRLDQGARNALGYLRRVLEAEPANATALKSVARIQASLVAEALAQAQAGEFGAADALLERAAAVDPDALQTLTDARAALAAARNLAAASLLREAHRRLDQGGADDGEALLEQALAIAPEISGAGLVRERIRNVRLYGGRAEGELFQDRLAAGGDGPAMVVIPVGSFLMGSPDDEAGRRANEGPQFRVRFDRGFALAQTEVTVAQFRRFVEATGHQTRAERARSSTIYDERSGSMRERGGIDWRNDETGGDAADDHPVIHIAWGDAEAYARWLAQATAQPYRLPSEAEFEYALRAGSDSRYPWGDGAPDRPLANVSTAGDRSPQQRQWSNAFPGATDGHFGIAPVRSFPGNAFAVHDLDGNVSEWTEDCWHSSYSRAPSDGQAWVNPGCSRRVVRGASWASGPEQVRAAYRLNIDADNTSPRVGFRVARDL
jgi:formylglycine-generating enzyme required for sulfatase activity